MSKFAWIIFSIILLIVFVIIFFLFWTYSPKVNMISDTNIPIQNRFENKIVYGSNSELTQKDYEEHCLDQNGKFNSCGSPCGPEAEFCILMCVYTCEFDGEDGVSFNSWSTYTSTNKDFLIAYPQEVQIQGNGQSFIQFMFTGATQTANTELFDGFMISVEKLMKNAQMTFEEFVGRERLNLQPIAKQLGEIQNSNFAGREAKIFQATTLGVFNYIYIPGNQSQDVYKITNFVIDPDNGGYKEAVERMLNSFELIQEDTSK